MARPFPSDSVGPSRTGRTRVTRAAFPVALLAVVLLAAVLVGRAERVEPGIEAGDDLASAPAGIASESEVEADIVVVQGGRERRYSSAQLPPDGRLVFRRYVDGRDASGAVHPPVAIADWIFRVVPDADEVRITLREPVESSEIRFDYRRDAHSPT